MLSPQISIISSRCVCVCGGGGGGGGLIISGSLCVSSTLKEKRAKKQDHQKDSL